MRNIKLLSLCTILILLLGSNASANGTSEKLIYDLTWTGVKAGEAALELQDSGEFIEIISRANSSKWVSVFYHVEDIIVSTLKKNNELDKKFLGLPYKYRVKLKEGKHRRDKEVIFDQSAKKITYINHLKQEEVKFDMKGFLLDPLSSFYYIRRLPLEVGQSVYVDIFDNKKIYQIEVQILKKESIKTPLGTFRTILIKPIMKTEGIFDRKGDIHIWLTDDEKRIPVQLKTKVAVGHINAILVSHKP